MVADHDVVAGAEGARQTRGERQLGTFEQAALAGRRPGHPDHPVLPVTAGRRHLAELGQQLASAAGATGEDEPGHPRAGGGERIHPGQVTGRGKPSHDDGEVGAGVLRPGRGDRAQRRRRDRAGVGLGEQQWRRLDVPDDDGRRVAEQCQPVGAQPQPRPDEAELDELDHIEVGRLHRDRGQVGDRGEVDLRSGTFRHSLTSGWLTSGTFPGALVPR